MVNVEGSYYEITVTDSRISEKEPVYCFSNFSVAYLYLKKFYESDPQAKAKSYPTFQNHLSEKGTYLCFRTDTKFLRFELLQKLNKEEIELLGNGQQTSN